jgi:hypothetical protein
VETHHNCLAGCDPKPRAALTAGRHLYAFKTLRDDLPSVGRFGVLEIQTMDFHGSYGRAVGNLKDTPRMFPANFSVTLNSNQHLLSDRMEGSNIANVFKRTFYQIMFKFQLGKLITHLKLLPIQHSPTLCNADTVSKAPLEILARLSIHHCNRRSLRSRAPQEAVRICVEVEYIHPCEQMGWLWSLA